jgi:hypothetical protein
MPHPTYGSATLEKFSCRDIRHSEQVLATLERHGCIVVVNPDTTTPVKPYR